MVGDCDSRSTGSQAIIGYSLTVAALVVLVTKGQLFASGLISVAIQGVAVLIVAWARAALGRPSGAIVMCRMRALRRIVNIGVLLVAVFFALTAARTAEAASAKQIDAAVDDALASLYASTPAAVELAKVAKGILVFPQVVKGGFILGAEFGNGALRKAGVSNGYYNTIGASYGFQAGVESFGYALFFVTDSALEYLDKSEGWEIGVGPTLTVIDQGVAKSFSTTTLKSDIYAFFFEKQGLMAGLSLQGSKISRITPDP